ncbi:hypothetical protein ACS0TY_032487 [Phlomoides rotata]
MVDAILSAAAQRIIALIEEQAQYHVNLVRGAEKEGGSTSKEVHSLAKELKTIRYVLNDAENRRFKEGNINLWLSRLEQTSHEMEDVLDEWSYAILKLEVQQHQSDDVLIAPSKKKVCSFVPSSSCLCFKKVVVRRDIAKKILNVKAQLDEILKEKDRYSFAISQPTIDPLPESWRIQSTSLINFGKVHGRDRDRDILASKLLMANGEESVIKVVSIVGMGGLGKTTLAQLLYNDEGVEKSFELRIWICVSDPFDLAAIAKGILESIKKGSSPNTNQLDVLFKHVKESISGKKFLLVLDDVWTEDYNKWEPLNNSLRCGGVGSKILVTTRNERVAKIMGTIQNDIHRPGQLSDEDCWLVLHHIALFGRNDLDFEKFEDIGKKIVKKCNGLPLAAKALGSVLRFKNDLEAWVNVLNSEIWEMKEAEVDLFPHLLLSYNELSPTLKHCFSYCAIFPKDSEIVVESLIGNWMALGYLGSNTGDMELKGREFFDVLAMRSLFQDFEKDDLNEIQSCKMHDIVHDFAQFLRKSSRVEVVEMNKTTCRACDALMVSNVNELCGLHCNKESPPDLCDCLMRLRVLSLTNCGLQSIPQGMENLIHLRWLNLDRNDKLSCQDLKGIFQLYNLQTLSLSDCSLEQIPREIGNLIHLRRLDLSKIRSMKELPKEIGNLIHLRYLDLSWNEALVELPREVGNLIHLRRLNLKMNGSLENLPREIGNLIHLTHLDLSWNTSLKKLPEEIRNLIQLRHLDLSWNKSLKELPESICGLQELKSLNVNICVRLCRLPEGLAQLTGLRTLSEFRGGSGWSKLRLLKNLNHLTRFLRLDIRLVVGVNFEDVIEDAREAKLRNKIHIEQLEIWFQDEMDENESSSSSRVRMDVIDALEPHPKLRKLKIWYYKGSTLATAWMVSPLNQLRKVYLSYFNHLTSLPHLGQLPCLEEIHISTMDVLQFVGRDFLGITTGGGGGETLNIQSSSNTFVVAFPKLKNLTFDNCSKWMEWEDITTEEEESATFSVMPCLTELQVKCCDVLTALPHRLLRKALSLVTLNISDSTELQQRYENKDGSNWKSISENNPHLRLCYD